MEEEIKIIFKSIGLEIDNFYELDGVLILRETLLSDKKYDEVKHLIPELKKNYSSSFMTSLQKNAEKSQKWPLINLIRQILHVYGYNMEPIRKSDGYTLEGVKKYKRYFLITNTNSNTNSNTNIKKIELNPNDCYDDNDNNTLILN
jgi:hypothetical protein